MSDDTLCYTETFYKDGISLKCLTCEYDFKSTKELEDRLDYVLKAISGTKTFQLKKPLFMPIWLYKYYISYVIIPKKMSIDMRSN